MTNAYAEVLAKIPTPVLLEAAKQRRNTARETLGSRATLKRAVQCPGCHGKFGVRELRRHKKGCRKFLDGRAKHLRETGKVRPTSPEWSFGWRGVEEV